MNTERLRVIFTVVAMAIGIIAGLVSLSVGGAGGIMVAAAYLLAVATLWGPITLIGYVEILVEMSPSKRDIRSLKEALQKDKTTDHSSDESGRNLALEQEIA